MTITAEHLVELFEAVRHAQKEYFRTRSASALEQSKRLERQVDQALADYRRQQVECQKSLFE